MAGNVDDGAFLQNAVRSSVSRNYVGRSISGTPIPNGAFGIALLDGANYNSILENRFGRNALGRFYIHPNAIGNAIR